MKLTRLALAAAIAGVLGVSQAQAQQLSQPTAFHGSSYDYYAQAPAVSPSDAPPPSVDDVAPAGPVESDYSCASCDSCAAAPCGCGDDDDMWRLFGPTCSGIEIGGWLQAGITFNGQGNQQLNGNEGVPFNNIAGEIVANQAWIYAEKAVDTGGCGTDWGFRVDYVFGADGPDTQAFGDQGFDFGWNSSNQYGSAIPQLYFELGVNDLTIKMGHFYTLIGYEVVPAPDNFFYSHALTMNYGEPFTHTGALASYAYSDSTTLYGGWTMGWDSGFDNFLDASTFLGGISHDVNDCTNISWMVNVGNFGDGSQLRDGNNGASGDIYMNSFVLQYELSECLKYVFQHDLGINDSIPGGGDNEWYGINQYLLYTVSDCVSYGLRAEWFRDDDGARIGNGTAADGDYYNLTLGVNYKPNGNIIVRPEVRWDKFDGNGLPYDNATQDNLFTAGFDAVFIF